MQWKKLGCVFNIAGDSELLNSHAQLPVVMPLDDRTVRVYFCSRDKANRSRPFYFEASIERSCFKLIRSENRPLLELGRPGQFDDSGVMFSSWIKIEKTIYMYYIGWTLKTDVPYQLAIGLAVSEDGLTWNRLFDGPVLCQNIYDTFATSLPVVANFKDHYVMFYLSSNGWKFFDNKPELVYSIAKTEFKIPHLVTSSGEKFNFFDESYAYAPSSLIKLGEFYYLFMCVRKAFDFRTNPDCSYRIYHSRSKDLVEFSQPTLTSGLEPTGDGFDSIMAEYLWAFKLGNNIYGFYNGDGFGKTGMGLAELVQD
ncbi:MAG: hypothetical protein NZO16_00705 [Deltaproteobacteria bacterium]|nr:hypothetical protein [Deltaproteobacteria bacterium]